MSSGGQSDHVLGHMSALPPIHTDDCVSGQAEKGQKLHIWDTPRQTRASPSGILSHDPMYHTHVVLEHPEDVVLPADGSRRDRRELIDSQRYS